MPCCVRGYHVYQAIWVAVVGEQLACREVGYSWLKVLPNRHDQRIAGDCSRQLRVFKYTVGPRYKGTQVRVRVVYTVINSTVLIIHCEKLSLLENIQVNYFRHSRGNEKFLTSKKRQITVILAHAQPFFIITLYINL